MTTRISGSAWSGRRDGGGWRSTSGARFVSKIKIRSAWLLLVAGALRQEKVLTSSAGCAQCQGNIRRPKDSGGDLPRIREHPRVYGSPTNHQVLAFAAMGKRRFRGARVSCCPPMAGCAPVACVALRKRRAGRADRASASRFLQVSPWARESSRVSRAEVSRASNAGGRLTRSPVARAFLYHAPLKLGASTPRQGAGATSEVKVENLKVTGTMTDTVATVS